MKPLVPIDQLKIFYDGIFTRPQLNHPECVVIDRDGHLWCGGEMGEIYRIDQNGKHMEQIATTDGFVLGLAFDSKDNLYICDLRHATVFRLNTISGELVNFAKCRGNSSMKTPNYPVVDEKRNVLYVSDSNEMGKPAAGLWRFDLTTGEGELWSDYIFDFANGLALSEDGGTLYIAETFSNKVSKLEILENGDPGSLETFAVVEGIPDGLVLDNSTQYLYICCYEPSSVYRKKIDDPNSLIELVVHDPVATTLCHPTNGAINQSSLYLANLGRWHITSVDLPK